MFSNEVYAPFWSSMNRGTRVVSQSNCNSVWVPNYDYVMLNILQASGQWGHTMGTSRVFYHHTNHTFCLILMWLLDGNSQFAVYCNWAITVLKCFCHTFSFFGHSSYKVKFNIPRSCCLGVYSKSITLSIKPLQLAADKTKLYFLFLYCVFIGKITSLDTSLLRASMKPGWEDLVRRCIQRFHLQNDGDMSFAKRHQQEGTECISHEST